MSFEPTGVAAGSRVIVVGSINEDVVASVEAIPGPGETVHGSALAYFQGGKGANQAVAAHRMGAPTRFVGRVGNDAAGARLREALRAEGLDVRIGVDPDAPTGTALISVDARGENSIVVIPGANGRLAADEGGALDGMAAGDVLLLQHEIPSATNRALAAGAQLRGGRVILNAAPARRLEAADLAAIDVLVANEHELGIALGISDAGFSVALDNSSEDLLRVEREVGDRALQVGVDIVLTLGEHGSVASFAGVSHVVPAHRVEPVDTTGAGDCFTGALAAGLARGDAPQTVLDLASRAAGLSVTRPGAADSFPDREAVAAMGREWRRAR
jgi:ribokinase